MSEFEERPRAGAKDEPNYEEERRACLFLSLLQAKLGRSVVSRIGAGPFADVVGRSAGEFAAFVRATERGTERVKRLFDLTREEFDPDETLRLAGERGIRTITLADEDYPRRLRETPDPPPALYVDGEIPEGVFDGATVAIVGPRRATVGALEVARGLGEALARRGVVVVSGLALGVDAAAHRGSLAVSGGSGATVGVLGCGIDVVYPRQNRALFAEIRERGAIVSEYFLGEAPLAWRFPARNRIVSGLSGAVVVVEAGEKSGALITARHAADAGREVWAAPGPVGMDECRGSNRLISDGASVLWDIEEFVDAVAPAPQPGANDAAQESLVEDVPEGLPESEAAALSAVGFGASSVDDIASRSGMGVAALLPALGLLEIKGYISRDSAGAFSRKASLR